MSTTIRVSVDTRDRVAALAEESGQTMTAVVDDALDALERRRFFAAFNDRYAELRNEPDAWAEVDAERTREAHTLRDAAG